MAYLKNSTVNLLNLHYGLHWLIINGAGVFYLVFLLRANVPVPAVFGTLALIVAGRFLFRPLILVLAPRFGLRKLLIFGTVFSGLQYVVLAEVRGIDLMLLALILASAAGDIFYWTTYHAYFAKLGDAEHRGHQIGAREAIGSLAAIIGPLIVASTLVALGPRSAFGAAAAMHLLAALPLFGTPEVPVAASAPGVFRAAIPGILLFAADAWLTTGTAFAWQIALFLSLGESFSSFGGAVALAALVGAVGGLVLGRHIDAGHGGRAVWITFICLGATIIIRSLSTGNATLAVTANAASALATCLYMPTLMTAVYNQAKNSACTLRFHLAAEGGWDVGAFASCILAAILSGLGVPLSVLILFSLAGVGMSLALLRRYYANTPIVVKPGIVEPLLPGI